MSKDVIPMGRPVRELPEQAVLELRRLYAMDETHLLDAYLRALAEAGWGYQPSATVLGVARQTIHQRVLRGSLECEGLPEVPALPTRPERPAPPTLSREQVKRLRALQAKAVKLKGHHKPDDPRRQASEELSRFIDELTRVEISYKEIGAAIGVQPMTVRARLKRHGYRLTNPTLKPYGGHRPQEATNAHAS
jgi:DNA-directed RNA polymerase specialized sigma24 family protein